MLENYCNAFYHRYFLLPLLKRVNQYCSPIFFTILSALLGFLILPALFFHQPIIAVFLLLGSGYCDTIDGALARYSDKTSPFGAALDITVDRLVEFFCIMGFWLIDQSRSGYCLLMLGSILICVTSFLVVGVFTQNNSHKSFHYSPGLMERAEAFIFFTLILMLPEQFNILALLFSILVFWTALWRLIEFYRALSHS